MHEIGYVPYWAWQKRTRNFHFGRTMKNQLLKSSPTLRQHFWSVAISISCLWVSSLRTKTHYPPGSQIGQATFKDHVAPSYQTKSINLVAGHNQESRSNCYPAAARSSTSKAALLTPSWRSASHGYLLFMTGKIGHPPISAAAVSSRQLLHSAQNPISLAAISTRTLLKDSKRIGVFPAPTRAASRIFPQDRLSWEQNSLKHILFSRATIDG